MIALAGHRVTPYFIMSDSLLALARARLTGIFSETAANAQCVLLVDQHTLPLLSSSVKLSELLESASHITLVESVDAPLVPGHPRRSLLYWTSSISSRLHWPRSSSLSPTTRSQRAPHPPMADGCTLSSHAGCLSSSCSDCAHRRLLGASRPCASSSLDFLPISSSAFSLGATDALRRLYGPCEPRVREAYLATLAEQLSTVYRALGQPAPRVRYSQECHPIAEAFATRLDALLRDASSRARESAAASVGGQPARASQRGTLLILERARSIR